MKIDPVFPSAPLVNPPRYKFKPVTSRPEPLDDEVVVDEVVAPGEAWPGDVKLLMLLTALLTLTVLFS